MHRRPQFEPLARLAAAGCGLLGPEIRVGWGLFCLMRTSGPLISRWRVVPLGAAAAALPPVRSWVGCAAWVRLGAWPVSRVGAYILPGAAAAASPPVRVRGGCAAWDWAGRLAFVSRWCACPAGAQGMLMHRSCAGHCRPFSPLQTIAPSQRGLQA